MEASVKEIDKEDKKSMAGVIACHSFYQVINLFVSTFLIAYIYSQTSNTFSYIFKSCLYEVSNYFGMLIFIPLFSVFIKKYNKVLFLRLGCLTKTIFVVCLIFFGKQLSQWIILAGILNGFASAGYFASYNVIKHDVVSIKGVKNFTSLCNVINKFVLVIVPIILGALIDISTYNMVAIYVAILGVIQIIITFLIKDKVKEKSFSFKSFFSELKKDKQTLKKFSSFYLINAIYAFYTVLKTLLDINVMLIFGSNFSLGTISAVYAFIQIFVYILFNKFTKEGKRTGYYIFLFTLPIISSILFVNFSNIATLIMFNVCIALSEGVVRTVFDIIRYRVLKEINLHDRVTEHQTMSEIIFNIFRFIGYCLVIVVSLLNSSLWFKTVFCLCSALFGILLLLMARHEKKYSKKSENNDKN